MHTQHAPVLQPDKWVDAYADQLFRFVLSRTHDPQAAEDIVQETFLSAWKGRSTYNGIASEKNWLFAICKNRMLDHFRRQSLRISIVDGMEEAHYFDVADHWTEAAQPSPWDPALQQRTDTREFQKVLAGCLARLKDLQNAVFALKYLEDLEAEDICAALRITPSNYWVLLHRAKLQLRACLEKNWINL